MERPQPGRGATRSQTVVRTFVVAASVASVLMVVLMALRITDTIGAQELVIGLVAVVGLEMAALAYAIRRSRQSPRPTTGAPASTTDATGVHGGYGYDPTEGLPRG